MGAVLGYPPRKVVTQIKEVTGPRGGKIIVLMLACGHWKQSRTPMRSATCVACYIEGQLKEP